MGKTIETIGKENGMDFKKNTNIMLGIIVGFMAYLCCLLGLMFYITTILSGTELWQGLGIIAFLIVSGLTILLLIVRDLNRPK